MRTAEEIRTLLIDGLRVLFDRPRQCAVDPLDLQARAVSELNRLCYIDGREHGGNLPFRRYGELGISGPFQTFFGKDEGWIPEVAVVLAHYAHRIGYLEVDNVLDSARFRTVRSELRERYDEVDVHASELLADLGEPTYRVGDSAWAYGSADAEDGWMFFAFVAPAAPTYVPGSGEWFQARDEDRLLRITWTSEGPFEDTMHLTLRGKLEAWGPGWSWNHGWRGEGAPPGVREQLEAIHAADPAQHLGQPFGD